MTNEFNGEPMGKHAQQPRVNQVASQLSESLPVVNVDTSFSTFERRGLTLLADSRY